MFIKNQFPKNFIWGTATSAGQVEGGILQDGRGLSIWDAFSHVPGNILDGSTTNDACDSYRLYKDDIKLLKDLGVNSYRFSISWSRVLPEGKGKVNQAGLDYYKRLVEGLNENGIAPNCTLYHWDLPYELHRLGGWLNRDSVNWFSDYAELTFKTFGDSVPMYATINEPIAVYVGYAQKSFAPGFGVDAYGRQACHNILVAHGKAVNVFRAQKLKSKIGVAIDIWNRVPLDANNPADVMEAERGNENAHRFFLNPMLKGKYTDYILRQMQADGTMPKILDGDMDLISAPLDFWGLNVYNRMVVSASEKIDVVETIKKNGGQYFSNGQEFYPQAVYDCAKMLREEYGLKIPLIVTENGTFFVGDEPKENGKVIDEYRIKYMKGFLSEIARANADGYDISGYYHWSLIDNFEWSAGNSYKFGLCSVEKESKARAFKKSAEEYSKIISNNGFED